MSTLGGSYQGVLSENDYKNIDKLYSGVIKKEKIDVSNFSLPFKEFEGPLALIFNIGIDRIIEFAFVDKQEAIII